MTTRMQQRRGTATQWTTADPILAAGEIGVETDTNQFKLGDGINAWSDLSYFKNLEDLGGSLDDYVLVSTKGQANGVASLDGTGNIPSAQLANIIAGAPAALDTLNEISAVLGNPSNITGNIISQLGQLDTNISTVSSTASGHTTSINTLNTTVANHTTALASNATSIATNTSGISTISSAQTSHINATTGVHGIADTSLLATKTYADDKASLAQSTAQTNAAATADSKITTHAAVTTSVHGISNTANLVYTADSRLSDERTPSAGSVTAVKIASDAVTTAKILDANVTAAKIASDAVTTVKILDSNVTTAKIADAAITTAKIASGAVTKSMVGLGNVDNTADSAKPVSTAVQTALDLKATVVSDNLKAPLASPALTGVPTAPTATAGTNTTQIATTQFVGTAVSNLVASAPAALDTLNELATALGNDASFSTTVTNSIATKAPIASPTFTGTVTVAAAGVAFADGTQTKAGVPSITTILPKTASYTLSALTERDNLIEMASASAVTLTVPTNATVAYPVGTAIDILQTSTGQITVAGAAGVTINATPGLKLRTQWSSATLIKRATDTWVLTGDLTA